jgi:hypothetical protein
MRRVFSTAACMGRVLSSLFFVLSGTPAAAAPPPPPETGWDAVDKVIGSTGKDLPGDVHRYGWPRSDLAVSVGGVKVEPALALGGWAAFKRMGSNGEAMAMGDLVVLESELEPLLGELESGGSMSSRSTTT